MLTLQLNSSLTEVTNFLNYVNPRLEINKALQFPFDDLIFFSVGNEPLAHPTGGVWFNEKHML